MATNLQKLSFDALWTHWICVPVVNVIAAITSKICISTLWISVYCDKKWLLLDGSGGSQPMKLANRMAEWNENAGLLKNYKLHHLCTKLQLHTACQVFHFRQFVANGNLQCKCSLVQECMMSCVFSRINRLWIIKKVILKVRVTQHPLSERCRLAAQQMASPFMTLGQRMSMSWRSSQTPRAVQCGTRLQSPSAVVACNI